MTVVAITKEVVLAKLRRSVGRCTMERILCGCITAWYGNCSAQDRKKLQKVVCKVQTIMEANLLSMDSKYAMERLPTSKTHSILAMLSNNLFHQTEVIGKVGQSIRDEIAEYLEVH
eukprot:g31267.t1